MGLMRFHWHLAYKSFMNPYFASMSAILHAFVWVWGACFVYLHMAWSVRVWVLVSARPCVCLLIDCEVLVVFATKIRIPVYGQWSLNQYISYWTLASLLSCQRNHGQTKSALIGHSGLGLLSHSEDPNLINKIEGWPSREPEFIGLLLFDFYQQLGTPTLQKWAPNLLAHGLWHYEYAFPSPDEATQ